MSYLLYPDTRQETIDLTPITCSQLSDLIGWRVMPLVQHEDLVVIGTLADRLDGNANPAASALANVSLVGTALVLSQGDWVRMQARTLGWGDCDDALTRAMLVNPGGHGALLTIAPECVLHLSWELGAPSPTAAILVPQTGDFVIIETAAVATISEGLSWFIRHGYVISRDSSWHASHMSIYLVPPAHTQPAIATDAD